MEYPEPVIFEMKRRLRVISAGRNCEAWKMECTSDAGVHFMRVPVEGLSALRAETDSR